MGWWLSPPLRLLLGIPIKLAIIGKIESARGKMGKGTRREPLFSLSPSIVPRALSFSFSPASPQYKEASAEERGVVIYCKLPLITPLPTPPAKKYIRWWDPRPPLAWACITMNWICYDILKLNKKPVNAAKLQLTVYGQRLTFWLITRWSLKAVERKISPSYSEHARLLS